MFATRLKTLVNQPVVLVLVGQAIDRKGCVVAVGKDYLEFESRNFGLLLIPFTAVLLITPYECEEV